MRVDMDMELGSVWTPACDTEPHPSGVCDQLPAVIWSPACEDPHGFCSKHIIGTYSRHCQACKARWQADGSWTPPRGCLTPRECTMTEAEFCDA